MTLSSHNVGEVFFSSRLYGHRLVFSSCRPDHYPPIHTAGAELPHCRWASFIDAYRADCILVRRVQLRVIFRLAPEIHLSEHVQCRVFSSIVESRPALGLYSANQFPALLSTMETESLTVITCGDYL